MTLQEIQDQVLQLPIGDRWRLVQSLLSSIQQEMVISGAASLEAGSLTERQAIQVSSSSVAQWPEAILLYEGIPDFPAFESYRDELLPPSEPELF